MDDKDLQIEDIALGNGDKVKELDTIIVHYTGTFQGGTKFDSSRDRNEPFEVKIGAGYVIKGWDLGIPGMQKGGKRKLTIPYHLAYGKYGTDGIPPMSDLIFEIELLKIK